MSKTGQLTAKQLELLRVVAKGNEDGSACDLDQILDRIRYCTTKDSLQFSLRILAARGMLVKLGVETRRGAKRRLIGITPAGQAAVVKPRPYRTEHDNIVILGFDTPSVDLEGGLEVVPDFIIPGGL
jgi:hypothetical protein